MGNPGTKSAPQEIPTATEDLVEQPSTDLTEEVWSIVSRAKHQADEILEKARELLREARSVQGSRDLSFEEHRSEARKIGFDEGFRLGRERGRSSAEQDAVLQTLAPDSPEAVAALEKAALRLLDERASFETEKRRLVDGLRRVMEATSASEEELSATLLAFLKEHPPSVTLTLDEPSGEAQSRPARRRERRSRRKDVVTDRTGVRAGDR